MYIRTSTDPAVVWWLGALDMHMTAEWLQEVGVELEDDPVLREKFRGRRV